MNKFFSSLFLVLVVSFPLMLTGCETIKGAGQDIETAGESVQDAVDNAKDSD